MVFQEKATQTEPFKNRSHKYFGLTSKNVLQFASSLILPLMLGIFTVVITFQQQNLARQQRLEDKEESQRQRDDDRKELQQQREQDKNLSQLQRDNDWNISQTAQQAQSKAIRDQYQDGVLVEYIKEIAKLLEKKMGSLTSDPMTHTIARIKTLNTIRQLDGSRQIYVIRFLHEARQLTNTNESIALDISTAELTEIDFQKSGRLLDTGELSLAGVYLVNSTFSNMHLRNVNFSSALLGNVTFSSAYLFNVTFSSADLKYVNFSSAWLENVTFLSAWLKNVTFSHTLLINVKFSSAWLENVTFSHTLLANVTFSSAERLTNVNFSSAVLFNVNFSSARFYDYFGLTHFDHANMIHTIFERCDCHMVDFSYANLKNSSFHSARLSGANFSLANLQDVDFTNTTITDNQLQSALSIRNAKLPNGTLGRGRNLVKNGDTNCDISLVDHWKVQNGNITVVPSKEDGSQCQFTLQSIATGAIMSQPITLAGIWDSSFWRYSNVELQGHMSSGVSMELNAKNSNGTVLEKDITNSSQSKIIMWLQKYMQELEIVVKFDAHKNKNNSSNSWCDNIELFIDYNP